MSRILFAWELGLGFGHLAPYLDFVKALRKKGHQVIFAARDTGNADEVFGEHGVAVLQAPVLMRRVPDPFKVTDTYVHIMHNLGFADVGSLFALVKSWLHIYRYVRPHAILFDHSPTALLAVRALKVKRIISGSGFLIPPAVTPLPLMRYWVKVDMKRIAADEARALKNANEILRRLKLKPMQRLAELFQSDGELLLSSRELDHYPNRKDGNYLGMFPVSNYGEEPEWPKAGKKKVFAYLYPFKTLPELVKAFNALDLSVIVYAPQVLDEDKRKYASPRVKFVAKPQNVITVGRECDAVITNGTFGTTSSFLLAGKPVLAIPLNLERLMVARRVVALGAGMAVQPNNAKQFGPAIKALLDQKKFTTAARSYARKYEGLNLQWQTGRMLRIIDQVLATAETKPDPAAEPSRVE